MNKELARTLTVALVDYIDENRPEGAIACSSGECVSLEKAFTEDNFDSVETLIKKKLSRLTEFEQALSNYLKNDFEYFHTKKWDEKKWNDVIRTQSKELIAIAREQLIKDGYVIEKKSFYDAVKEVPPEVMKEVSDNVDKENELAKKHLDGYTMGREDAMREMSDFLKSHFNSEEAKGYNPPAINIPTWTPPCYIGGPCTNPQKDCINCPRKTTGGGFYTTSGTSASKAEDNASATDGKEHNPSFTD